MNPSWYVLTKRKQGYVLTKRAEGIFILSVKWVTPIELYITRDTLPASWHVWPHPLKQHFWVPVQLESIWQLSTQVAEEFLAGTGHIPSLDSEMTTTIVLLSTGVVLPENMRPRTISFLTSNEHEVVVHGEFVNAARSRGIASRLYGVCQGYKGTVVSELQIRIHTASPAIANTFEGRSIPEYAYKIFGTGTIL